MTLVTKRMTQKRTREAVCKEKVLRTLFLSRLSILISTEILFTNDLYVVRHVHELVPLLDHLLPESVVEELVPLERDGELSESAEDKGGQGGGHVGQDREQNSLCQRPLCPLALQDLNMSMII